MTWTDRLGSTMIYIQGHPTVVDRHSDTKNKKKIIHTKWN